MAQKKMKKTPAKAGKKAGKLEKKSSVKAKPVAAAAKKTKPKAEAKSPTAKKAVQASKPLKASPAPKAAVPKTKKVAAPVVVAEEPAPAPVEVKQTKKQALLVSKPDPAAAAEEKSIKKAKKALGRAKQNLAKARAKDFGSKLGKNLINQGMDELAKKWESLFKKADGIDSKPYRMKDSFEERTAIVHKILGWGFVLSNQNDRLEVLFRDGIRYLISNYKT